MNQRIASRSTFIKTLPQAVLLMGAMIFAVLLHMYLGASVGAVGFIWIVLLTITTSVVNAELSFTLMMVCFFLQNALVSIVSPAISSVDGFKLLLGTSFLNLVLTAVLVAPVWLKTHRKHPEASSNLIRWIFIFMATIVLYSLLGVFRSPLTDVLVYVRVYLSGVLLLALGVAFGTYLSEGFVVSIVKILAVVLLAWGIGEFFFSFDFYDLFNVAPYLHLKFASNGEQEAISNVADVINFSDRSYLNLTGSFGLNFNLIRPNGPELHPITYAYCSAFCSLICFIYRSYFLAFAMFVIVLLTGAKAALVMIIASYLLYFIYRRTRRLSFLKLMLGVVVVSYIIAGLAYGIHTNDYHVIGFFGGIQGFLNNPIGHGIGVGGNLSAEHQLVNANEHQLFQGFGADYGFESAIGVMLYQMGIGVVVFVLFTYKVWRNVWHAASHLPDQPRAMIAPLALAIIFVNGIFQEEAFSPAGWGLWFMFSGFLLVKYWRSIPLTERIPNSRKPHYATP
jgi:hypothetical protein